MKKWMILLLAAGLCIAGVNQWRGLRGYSGQIYYEYGEGARPEGALLNKLAEQELAEGRSLPDMAAWTEEEDVEVENRSLGRVQKAARMVVWGDRELAASRSLAAGNYGYRSDARACVISRGLAMELFGSAAVVGMEVRCEGADYFVRGVTEDDRKMVIVPAKENFRAEETVGEGSGTARGAGGGGTGGSGADGGGLGGNGADGGGTGGSGSAPRERFPYLLLDYGSDRAEKAGADQLLYRYGIGSARYRVDGEICLALAGFFAFLPVWTALGRGLILYCRRERALLRRIAACAAAALAAAGTIWLLSAAGTRFPPDLIPSRWSDFGFWSERWRTLTPALRYAGDQENTGWMTLLRGRTAGGILCGCGAALGAAFAGGGIVRKSLLTLRDKVSKVGIGVNMDGCVSSEEDKN